MATTTAPDLSATHLQELVDAAAHFYVFSRPRPGGVRPIRDGGAVIGVELEERWHRLRAVTLGPPWLAPLSRHDEVGEAVATLAHRWLFCPDDFEAAPGVQPPPTAFDPSRSQRFVMLDGRGTFEDTDGQFLSFGAGHTMPSRPGVPVRAQAVGATLGGSGGFAAFDEGTIAWCGTLCPEGGFAGNALLRAMDRDGRFRVDRLAPGFRSGEIARDDGRYVIFRGQASPGDPVTPAMGPDGRPAGLTVVQSLRGLDLDCWVRGSQGPRTCDAFGPLIGSITAHVAFDPQAPGGGVADPIPFATFDEFHFRDRDGRRVGGFTADSSEGRVFKTLVGGQPAIRFAGVGMIREGDGIFAGIRGQMTDSSVVLFAPHVSASVYVLRITGRS